MARDLQRFRSFTAPGPNGCIVWTGARKQQAGYEYGFFSFRNRLFLAHRWIYEQTFGPQPGLVIMHKCDNPPCVNVEHLRAGTQADNVADSVSKGRHYIAPLKTHCVHGHALTAENTYTGPRGYRGCRICRKRHRARYDAHHAHGGRQ